MTRSNMRHFIGLSIITMVMLSIAGCSTLKAIAWVNGGAAEIQHDRERTVPFTMKGHTIIIKTRINDSDKAYNFIFDTGALTAVSRRLAHELNLKDGVEVRLGMQVVKVK